jgi:hypothetical protein
MSFKTRIQTLKLSDQESITTYMIFTHHEVNVFERAYINLMCQCFNVTANTILYNCNYFPLHFNTNKIIVFTLLFWCSSKKKFIQTLVLG